MRKIKIYLDYHCFPIWIYNDNGELIDNDLPEELSGDKQVEDAFMEIQNIYDRLFLDSSREFKYIGFDNEANKDKYLKLIDAAINLIKIKLGDDYFIEKNIEV